MRSIARRSQRVVSTITSSPSPALATPTRSLSTRPTPPIRASSHFSSTPRRCFSSSAPADAPLTPWPVFPPHKLPPAPKPVLDYRDSKYTKHVKLPAGQRLVVLGFGAIGQGVLPLLFRHVDMKPEQVLVAAVDFSAEAERHARDYGVKTVRVRLTKDDHGSWLQQHVRKGDFLLNVTVDVSSVALIQHCQAVGALYLDSCNEPWAGGYSDPSKPASARSNYAFREQALQLRQSLPANGPTALITHGANPGIVSHFVKQALLNLAADTGLQTRRPRSRSDWAQLMERLGVKVVHIAEKDTQASTVVKHAGEFVNTWSIEGYCEEGKQPAELGWGSHERRFPEDGSRHADGCDAAIYLNQPGANVWMRTWTPRCGCFQGMLITHTEAISIADYFTRKDEQGNVAFRPTVNFAYHPSADAVMSMREVAYQEWIRHPVERVMMTEIVSGRDELGVLLMGHSRNAYWYGSDLTIEAARAAAPNNNATSLQVCSSVLAGVVWCLEHPRRGLVEPEEVDEVERLIEVAKPYLGDLGGHYNADWTPLQSREKLFPEPQLDKSDPWQFDNFRVY